MLEERKKGNTAFLIMDKLVIYEKTRNHKSVRQSLNQRETACCVLNSILFTNILERDSLYLFYFKQLIFILFQHQLIFESFFSISLFYVSNLVDQSINQS